MSTPTGGRPIALVTGASAGIGEAYAAALARGGWDLVLVARRADRLEALAQTLRERHGGAVECLAADLADDAELPRVETRLRSGDLDLLVNNAGRGSFGPFWERGADEARSVAALNAVAAMRLTHAALERFVPRRRGAVVFVSSLNGFVPSPYAATYGASKTFVNSLAHALREELRGSGVRVQLCCPGFTRTEFQDHAEIPKQDIPGFAWTDADVVAEASLAALRRDRFLVVPGAVSKAMAALMRVVPHAVARRVIAWFSRPMLKTS